MKRLTGFLSVWFAVVFALFAVACRGGDGGSSSSAVGEKATPTQVVKIVVSQEKAGVAGLTLKGYMDVLATEGTLVYTEQSGMICSVNGVENDSVNSFYWMIYCNDADYTTTAYYVEYEGVRYDSALVGFSELPVKAGCTYLLAYQGF